MNVLVVGGAGYIGSAVCSCLLSTGHSVTVLDDLSKGHREALSSLVKFVQGDLGDIGLVEKVCRQNSIDIVFHFAAFIEVGESVREPSRYYENNTIKTKHLLDGLLAAGVDKFVFSSTAAVYGEPSYIPIDEKHPKKPTNPYGWSKLFIEEILASYHQAYGMRSVILRYFNAAGALNRDLGEDHSPESHLIPLILQVALGKRESIQIFGTDWDTPDGTCIRDYIHIIDLANAHLLAMQALFDGMETGCFNLGNGEGHSVRQVIDCARKVTGHSIPVIEVDRRPGDPARLVASSALARSTLGWEPKYPDLESIVSSAWAWHQSHPQGYK